MSDKPLIKCRKLSKKITSGEDELILLQDIDLHIIAGESIAITGRSGSGKTTLIRLLTGLDQPSSGEIYLLQQPLHKLSEDERAALRQRYIGIVFQSFHLLAGFNALENVMLPLELAGISQAEEIATALLERVGLADRRHHYPTTLSGGEQQRVAIARAFATTPTLLFADEPTGNLDSKTGEIVMELLFQLNQEQGVSLILVTHAMSLSSNCDRTLHLSSGRLL